MVAPAAMHAPYTDHPADAFQAAQVATGALLMLVGYPLLRPRGRAVFATWATATWLAVLAPVLAALATGLGIARGGTHGFLWASALLVVLSAVLSRRWRNVLLLAPVTVGLVVAGESVTDFESELCAAYVVLAGFALSLLIGAAPSALGPRRDVDTSAILRKTSWGEHLQDLVLFASGTLAAALVSYFVLSRSGDGSDETAYTYQAAVYAKGQLYGRTPPCMNALRNFWLFWRDDRMFAQYQPGWPLFLVPFVWIRAIWLGGPASFGLLCMAVGRLARRAAMALPWTQRAAVLRAGAVAGGAALLSNTLLINGGSRFPHVFTAALFALCVDATWALGRTTVRRDAAWLGLLLGNCAGWLALVRAPDAVLLASGPVLYLLVATVRRRAHWIGLVVAVLGTLPWILFFFWSAHEQVGVWGVMPYQLIEEFYPWAHVQFSLPKPHQWKWPFPLAVGAYCWWPLSPGLGLAGLVVACRERSTRPAAFMLTLSGVAVLIFYGLLEFGRGDDFGYGPRYTLVLVVPTAIGTALLVERALKGQAERLRRAQTFGLFVTALVCSCLIAKDMFPSTYRLLRVVSGPERAAGAAKLKRAIVVIPPGVTPYGPPDVTRNVPIELYDPPVIYANDTDTACLRRAFPNRTVYRASGRDNVTLTPLEP